MNNSLAARDTASQRPSWQTGLLLTSANNTEKKFLGVELASPEKIRKWAERLLPTGKIVGAVLNANTIHHKTLKPIKGGLFCERIFGPTKDFRCACGKSITKQTAEATKGSMHLKIGPSGQGGSLAEAGTGIPFSKVGPSGKEIPSAVPNGGGTLGGHRTYVNKALFCKICEVEYTSSLLRRYQLGYIPLAFPVTHLWYTKGFSNPISLLLDIHKYDLDFIIYCNKITSIEKSVELTEITVGKDPIELVELIKKSKKRKTKRKTAVDPMHFSSLSSDGSTPKKGTTCHTTGSGIPFPEGWTFGEKKILRGSQEPLKGFPRRVKLAAGGASTNVPHPHKANLLLNRKLQKTTARESCRVVGTPPDSESVSTQQETPLSPAFPRRGPNGRVSDLVSRLLFDPADFSHYRSKKVHEKGPSRQGQEFHSPRSGGRLNLREWKYSLTEPTSFMRHFKIKTDFFQKRQEFHSRRLDLREWKYPSGRPIGTKSIEREYYKSCIQLRKTLLVLPKQTLAHLNKQFYKQSYRLLNQLTSKYIKITRRARNSFPPEGAEGLGMEIPFGNRNTLPEQYASERQASPDPAPAPPFGGWGPLRGQEEFLEITYTPKLNGGGPGRPNLQTSGQPKQYLEYFLQELRNRIDLHARPSSPFSAVIQQADFQRAVQHFGIILVSFLLTSFKRKQALFASSTGQNLAGTLKRHSNAPRHNLSCDRKRLNILGPSGTLPPKEVHPEASVARDPSCQAGLPRGSSGRFVYNIYEIADDHLWDNLEDWNILKSYITVAPSIVDALIPYYSQRITFPTLKNRQLSSLNPIQAIYEYTITAKGLLRGNLSQQLRPRFPRRGERPGIPFPKARPSATSGGMEIPFRVPDDGGIAIPTVGRTRIQEFHCSSYGVGAGILNLFFTSLTPTEVNSMDKQLSQLLRESRMNILLYKTKQMGKDDFSSGASTKGLEWKYKESKTEATLREQEFLSPKAKPSGERKYPSGARVHKPPGPRNPPLGSGIPFPPLRGNAKPDSRRSPLLTAKSTYWKPSAEIRYSRIDIWMEKHHEILRRSKTIRKFSLAKILPEFMVLKMLPVLPPELRPIRKGNDGDILTSDLNRLYQRVLFRNERLNNIILPYPEYTPGSSSLGPMEGSKLSSLLRRNEGRKPRTSSVDRDPSPSEKLSLDMQPLGIIKQRPGIPGPSGKEIPFGGPLSSLGRYPARTKSHAEASRQTPSGAVGIDIPLTRNPKNLRASESLAPLFGYEKHFTQRLLQEAIDNLIDNGRSGGSSEVDAKGRLLKSLSEVLKGKQGRFRQYLLGKRVDYSGRSVIVVGPKLKIHQCGLPREMALELYLPFIIQYLIQMKYTRTVVGAKSLIAHQPVLITTILDDIVQGHPVVLNRAPTLHRLGFQAFQPILVDGRAILLHPMACTAFNADFDGDQMAVHIPITVEARAEAWRLMLARNNLLSPATGDPILLPSQDMILGCYYLTTLKKMPLPPNNKLLAASSQRPAFGIPDSQGTQSASTRGLFESQTLPKKCVRSYYTSIHTVLNHYSLGKIHVHTPIWLKTKKKVFVEASKKPYEIRISYYCKIEEISKNCIYHSNQSHRVFPFQKARPSGMEFLPTPSSEAGLLKNSLLSLKGGKGNTPSGVGPLRGKGSLCNKNANTRPQEASAARNPCREGEHLLGLSRESVDYKYIRTTAGRILFNSILTRAYRITADV